MNTKSEPLLLSPFPREIVWGGNRLANEFGVKAPFEKIAEAWLLTVRRDGMSYIVSGDCAGNALSDWLDEAGNEAVSSSGSFERFPLLIKFIDAKDDLSIQVHPDDAYALPHENEFGKTEMWYIIDAEPDAHIVWGLADGVTAEQFRNAVDHDDVESSLSYVPVKKGDVFFIPSGLVHAICHGVLIAEIQQNSDVTYRIYDYHRPGLDGKPRTLHTSQAKDVVRVFSHVEIESLRYSRKPEVPGLLASSEYFTVREWEVHPESVTELCVKHTSFVSLICLDGSGVLRFHETDYPVNKGDSYFLPAGLGQVFLSGDMHCLTSSILP